MKLIVDGSKMKEAVSSIKSGLGNAKMNLLYETIGLWTDNGNLVLETQDDITKMTAIIPCDIEEDGEFRCNGSVFINLVGQLGGDVVEFETKGDNLTIKQGKAKVKVKAVQGFAIKDTDDQDLFSEEFEVNGAELSEAISRAVVCVSKNDTRLLLRCINFSKSGDRMRVCSLDGFRVSRYFVSVVGNMGEFSASMPTKAVSSLIALCDSNKLVKVKIGATRIAFIGENTAIFSGLYDGQFYNVDRNFIANAPYSFTIDTKELKKAVGLATITVDTTFNTMELSFNVAGKELGITSQKDNAESAVVIGFETDCDGADISTALNAQFVNELLKTIKADSVVLELVSEQTPVVVREEDSENSFLLLPIRRM